MDKAATGVDADEQPDPERLKEDIDGIRRNLGGLVAELDRRRHEAFDVRLQISRHPLPFILAGIVVTSLIGVAVAGIVHQRREQRRLATRLRRWPPRLHQLRLALSRAMDHPDRVANQPGVGKKMLAAGGSATAAMVGKRLAARLIR